MNRVVYVVNPACEVDTMAMLQDFLTDDRHTEPHGDCAIAKNIPDKVITKVCEIIARQLGYPPETNPDEILEKLKQSVMSRRKQIKIRVVQFLITIDIRIYVVERSVENYYSLQNSIDNAPKVNPPELTEAV